MEALSELDRRLDEAIGDGDVQRVEQLLNQGAHPNEGSLSCALANGDSSMVKFLLSRGVRPTPLDVESVSDYQNDYTGQITSYPNQEITRLIQEAASKPMTMEQGLHRAMRTMPRYPTLPQNRTPTVDPIIQAITTRNEAEVNRLASSGAFNRPDLNIILHQAAISLLTNQITNPEDTFRWLKWLIVSGA